MKFLLIVIVLASLTVTGCTNVTSYIYKQDRVDQKLEGNRGYLIGTPPPAPEVKEVPQRTLFGFDIEVPILPGEEGYVPSKKKFELNPALRRIKR